MINPNKKRRLAWLAVCFLTFWLQATQSQASVVPAGFESLLAPQTTLIDIYYGDRFVNSQLATFTPSTIEFSQPALITAHLSDLLEPNAVLSAINGELDAHAELICQYQGQQSCGELEPLIAGVIFDENRFRVDLYINAHYLSVRSLKKQKFLPASDSQLSWLQSLHGAYSESGGSVADYSLFSNSTLAFKETRLNINGDIDQDDNKRIQTLALQHDWQGKNYQAGILESDNNGLLFMPNNSMRGVRIASTLDTRNDLRLSSGNQLIVFLRSRSRVSLYKDDRLITTARYEAGNQTIDTTLMPGGAYDVEIRIKEDSGAERSETRFYSKSNQLPPVDQALYFFEAGELIEQNAGDTIAKGIREVAFRAGYNTRLNDQTSLNTGFSHTAGINALEVGSFFFSRNYDFNVNAAVTDQQGYGLSTTSRLSLGAYQLNGGLRRIWNSKLASFNSEYDNLGSPVTQANLNLSYGSRIGRLSLGGNVNRTDDDTQESYNASFDLPRIALGTTDLLLGMRASRESGASQFVINAQLRFGGKNLSANYQADHYTNIDQDHRRDNTLQQNASLSWQDNDLLPDDDLNITLTHSDAPSQTRTSTGVDWDSHLGAIKLQHESTSSGQTTTRSNSGVISTSFMINGDSITLGGREQTQSALLIKINGQAQDPRFKIVINGADRGRATAGGTTAINLRPFETYQVQLQHNGEGFIEYSQQKQSVTLYPGNVVTLNWDIAATNIVFGRLSDQHGDAISNALIEGVSGLATTDEYGFFQAEIRNDTEVIKVKTREASCELELPEISARNGIASLGELSCEMKPNTQ